MIFCPFSIFCIKDIHVTSKRCFLPDIIYTRLSFEIGSCRYLKLEAVGFIIGVFLFDFSFDLR